MILLPETLLFYVVKEMYYREGDRPLLTSVEGGGGVGNFPKINKRGGGRLFGTQE